MTTTNNYESLSIDEFHSIIKPVDRPIRSINYGFLYLENWLKSEEENIQHGIVLNPDFQRGHVWAEHQQVHFVENVLRRLVGDDGLTIRMNCPSWREKPKADSDLLDQMVCIDGLQRLTAIRKFIAGEIKPFGLSFSTLPKRVLLREHTLIIQMYDFQYRIDLLQFYLDINGGGTAHSVEELDRVRGLLNKALSHE